MKQANKLTTYTATLVLLLNTTAFNAYANEETVEPVSPSAEEIKEDKDTEPTILGHLVCELMPQLCV